MRANDDNRGNSINCTDCLYPVSDPIPVWVLKVEENHIQRIFGQKELVCWVKHLIEINQHTRYYFANLLTREIHNFKFHFCSSRRVGNSDIVTNNSICRHIVFIFLAL
jgi:hypothetical protein